MGAYVAALIAVSHKMKIALIIGITFLLGGIANVFMLPAPLRYNIVDLTGAYVPMAWLGRRLAKGNSVAK